jgi:hypothetical protein
MGPLWQIATTPIKNKGSHSISQFAPLAVTRANVPSASTNSRSLYFEVKSLEDFAYTDFTYVQGIGFSCEGGKIAANKQGAATFDFSMPLLAACEDVTLAATDLLVMEMGQKYLQKLDNGHGKVLGIFRSLREQKQNSGWRLHVVVPIAGMFDAELTASMSAASNGKTGASTANAKLYIPDIASSGNMKDGPTIKVTNRSLDSTGLSGDYIQVDLMAGEFRPKWVDC